MIKKDKDFYLVESSSSKGKFYKVDPAKPWCDCASFKFREMRNKTECKHVREVREYLEAHPSENLSKKDESDSEKILSFIREEGDVDSTELIDKFGEESVDRLIRQGEILEKNGRIRLLE